MGTENYSISVVGVYKLLCTAVLLWQYCGGTVAFSVSADTTHSRQHTHQPRTYISSEYNLSHLWSGAYTIILLQK